MNNREKELILKYWSKTDLGKKMILSNHVSYSDLLFMIPNNVKRRYGLPATRTLGKRKLQTKRNRKHRILGFKLFVLIEEIIDKTLTTTYDNEFFNSFVDIKNFAAGDQNDFKIEPRIDVSIPSGLYRPLFRFSEVL
jgi:hypothetical protein